MAYQPVPLEQTATTVSNSIFKPVPVDYTGGGGGGGAVAWGDITDKPAVIASGTTDATARASIGAAPLVAPTFTGVPAAPTAAVATSTTQLATTAFVNAATRGKTQVVAIAAQPAATGADAAALLIELNATITKLNAVIAALKA